MRLHLFAGSPEEDRPDANDPNVHYFGPGVHDCGEIILQSGQTVYLAGGAVVYGGITGTDIENIRICGRGILDNSRHERGIVRPIVLHGCRNVTIEGIIIRDACEWVLTAAGCTNVQINNIKADRYVAIQFRRHRHLQLHRCADRKLFYTDFR